jgi:putative endonuclease
MNHDSGRHGEDVAARHFENNGYQIIHRNYRVREGEIDIIAANDTELVFAEVKYRKTRLFGGAIQSFPQKRIQRLNDAAQVYIQKNPGLSQKQPRLVLVAIQDEAVNEITLD